MLFNEVSNMLISVCSRNVTRNLVYYCIGLNLVQGYG